MWTAFFGAAAGRPRDAALRPRLRPRSASLRGRPRSARSICCGERLRSRRLPVAAQRVQHTAVGSAASLSWLILTLHTNRVIASRRPTVPAASRAPSSLVEENGRSTCRSKCSTRRRQHPQVLLGIEDLGDAVAVRDAEVPRRRGGRVLAVPARRDVAVRAGTISSSSPVPKRCSCSSGRPTWVSTASSLARARRAALGSATPTSSSLAVADDRRPRVLLDQRPHDTLVADRVRRVVAHQSPSASPARSYAPSSLVSRGKPSVARCAECQLASARSSVSTGTDDGLRERRRAPLQQQRIADPEHALGGQRRQVLRGEPARAGQMQRVGLQLVEPEASEQHQQLVAPGAREAGQREPLEHPLEAPRGAPRGVARERRRLRAAPAAAAPRRSRYRRAPPTGGRRSASRRRARGRGRCAVRAGCRRGRAARRGAPRERHADAGERVLALERAQVGDQEAHPRRALEVARARACAPRRRGRAARRASASSRPLENAISSTRRSASAEARRPGTSSER